MATVQPNSIPAVMFIDNSGSTSGVKDYWSRVKMVIYDQNENVEVYLWNTIVCSVVTRSEALKLCDLMSGGGGTSPQCFIPVMKTLSPDTDVIIITDGDISESDVKQCTELLSSSTKFKEIVLYLFGRRANLSVAAAFRQRTECFTLQVDDDLKAKGVNLTSPISLSNVQTVEDFLSNYKPLLELIVIQNSGMPKNEPLILELINLKKTLLELAAAKAAADFKHNIPVEDFHQSLMEDEESTFAAISTLVPFSDDKVTTANIIDTIINQMIDVCSGGRANFCLSQMKVAIPNRLERARGHTDVPLPESATSSVAFECPIFLETLLSLALMIQGGNPIFKSLIDDKDKKWLLELILNNPLEMLNHPDLVKALLSRVGHPISLDAFRMLGPHPICPFTRNRVTGLLCFGQGTDFSTSFQSNISVMAGIFFPNRKLVGNPVLWLSVIYLAIFQHGSDYLKESHVLDAFTPFMRQCLFEKKTSITLTGQANVEPFGVNVQTYLAILYCLLSECIIDKHRSPTEIDNACNRLRTFGQTSRHMMSLIDIIFPEIKYDREFVEKRIRIFWALSWMMSQEKDLDQKTVWRTELHKLYQRHFIVVIDGIENTIFTDGSSITRLEDTVFAKFGLTLAELFQLSGLVNANSTVGVIRVPLILNGSTPLPQANYEYTDAAAKDDSVTIHPATFRPEATFKTGETSWVQVWERKMSAISGPTHKQLSLFNYFIKYVIQFQKYPRIDEFLLWLSITVAQRETNSFNTLPYDIKIYVNYVFKKYEKILGENFVSVSVSEFIRVTNASRKEIDRIALENAFAERQ